MSTKCIRLIFSDVSFAHNSLNKSFHDSMCRHTVEVSSRILPSVLQYDVASWMVSNIIGHVVHLQIIIQHVLYCCMDSVMLNKYLCYLSEYFLCLVASFRRHHARSIGPTGYRPPKSRPRRLTTSEASQYAR